MARITVEDCLKQIDNRFGLIHLAAKRVRQLRKGAEPLVTCKNKDIVTALREIAAAKVIAKEPADESARLESRDSLLLEGIAESFTAVASPIEQTEPEADELQAEEEAPEAPEKIE